jgi:nucleoside-diphosphate-sugar epimerase
MKMLLTGAAGFLGRAVLERMLAKGLKGIRVLVRNEEGARKIEVIAGPANAERVEVFAGDYSAPGIADRVLTGVDRLVHVAASLKGTSTSIFGNNVVGSRVLLDAVLRSGTCRDILLVSSLGVYGLSGLPKNANVEELCPVDPQPERRDLYTYSKIWQEELFRSAQHAGGKRNFNLCIVRPGPIYGPGGTVLPARIGLNAPGCFLNFGNRNVLPLTYVDNCAEAIAFLANRPIEGTETFNVIDPDMPTAKGYLKMYRKYQPGFRFLSVPYPMVIQFARSIERYSKRSEGQIPPILTPYKAENMWKRVYYDNSRLLHEGWKPVVSTEEGLARTFRFCKVKSNTEV